MKPKNRLTCEGLIMRGILRRQQTRFDSDQHLTLLGAAVAGVLFGLVLSFCYYEGAVGCKRDRDCGKGEQCTAGECEPGKWR